MSDKKLGFGWMRLPITDPNRKETVDIDRAVGMAKQFLDRGFTYFDTAYMYHNYYSEAALREAVVSRYPRDRFTIADKMPMIDIVREGQQEEIFSDQLKKLGVDKIDYYLLHNLNARNYEKAKRFGTIEYIRARRAEGKVGQIGFSFHDTAEVLDRILTEHPEMEFVQLQINYLDWENSGVQSRLCYETARKHGKEIVVMEPVKGGTLAVLPREAEEKLREVHPDWSPASWAIRFAAGLPGVRMVLSGMSDEVQVDDNTAVMSDPAPLNEKELSVLNEVREILLRSIRVPCTGCRYCVEGDRCPQNLRIPNYFALYNQEGFVSSIS